jgi:threonine-phosphate decarboxylase
VTAVRRPEFRNFAIGGTPVIVKTNPSVEIPGGHASAPRVHGGDVRAAVARYGLGPSDFIDFSSNVNALGAPSSATRAARRALADIHRYPDPGMADLRNGIARYYGVKPEHVVCGNGLTGLIHLVPRVFRPRTALIPVPTFTEYAAAVTGSGGAVTTLELKESDGFRVDPVEVSFAFKGADMAFLCNPNNPTGRLTAKAEMLEIVRFAQRENVRLVVDEAFMDYTESESLVREAVQSPNLIVLRAFTKFFGLAGLRVGYALADAETAEALRSGQEPWTVSVPAGPAALAALNDWGYIRKTRKIIARERERVLEALRLLPGVDPFPCAANFILIKLTQTDSHSLATALGRRGILIRDCSSFPGLTNRFVRIAVRARRENERLLRALREVLIP